jgi:hypothetical protein
MALKHCNTCGQDRPTSEFSKHRNGLHSKCRPCNREYQRGHYQRNKSVYIAKAWIWTSARRTENALKVISYFRDHPCVDCGESDPVVLQFDHVRGKTRELSDMLSSGSSWDRISREIEKCEVRCANCHWRRRAKEIGWRKVALVTSVAQQAAGGKIQN